MLFFAIVKRNGASSRKGRVCSVDGAGAETGLDRWQGKLYGIGKRGDSATPQAVTTPTCSSAANLPLSLTSATCYLKVNIWRAGLLHIAGASFHELGAMHL